MQERICFVDAGDQTSSSRWFDWAGVALGASLCTFKDVQKGIEPDADIYVVERASWLVPWSRWRYKRVLCWFDDGYQYLPTFSMAYQVWKHLLDAFEVGLGRIYGLITPNRQLTQDWAYASPHAFFVPNYHNYDPIQGVQHRVGMVGWGGSSNHWASWRDTQAYASIPSEFDVTVVGNSIIANMIASHNTVVDLTDWLPHQDYLKEIASWECSVLPVHGEYDKRRSWIKALECDLVGTPWVAVGNAVEIYEGVPGGVCVEKAEDIGWAIEAALDKNYENHAAVKEWAWAQHIIQHLDEWRAVLLG